MKNTYMNIMMPVSTHCNHYSSYSSSLAEKEEEKKMNRIVFCQVANLLSLFTCSALSMSNEAMQCTSITCEQRAADEAWYWPSAADEAWYWPKRVLCTG